MSPTRLPDKYATLHIMSIKEDFMDTDIGNMDMENIITKTISRFWIRRKIGVTNKSILISLYYLCCWSMLHQKVDRYSRTLFSEVRHFSINNVKMTHSTIILKLLLMSWLRARTKISFICIPLWFLPSFSNFFHNNVAR